MAIKWRGLKGMRSGWRRVFCRTAVDQTVACSSGGGQAPEGAHFRGIFSGTLIAIRQLLSRPLKISIWVSGCMDGDRNESFANSFQAGRSRQGWRAP